MGCYIRSRSQEKDKPALNRLRRRYGDVLALIHLVNEHRGYSSLDRVLAAARLHHPEAGVFIAAVEKHRADERRHDRRFAKDLLILPDWKMP